MKPFKYFTCIGGPEAVALWLSGGAFEKLWCGGVVWLLFEPNKLRCCIIDRLKSAVELTGEVGDDAAQNHKSIEKN